MQNPKIYYASWIVKIVTAVFQFPATWHVFKGVFNQAERDYRVVTISTFMSILLIDVLIILVLLVLEGSDLDPLKKIPWVLVGLGLLAAIIAVGYKDEGVLSWAPRLGFIGLVLVDVFDWFVEFLRWRSSRERLEQIDRDKMVKARREMMDTERINAMNDSRVRDIVFRVQVRRLGNELNIEDLYGDTLDRLIDEELREEEYREVKEYVDEDVFVKQQDYDSYPFNEQTFIDHYQYIEGVPGEIYSVNGMYYFVSPKTDELFWKTSQDKPYSESGIKRAHTRHMK